MTFGDIVSQSLKEIGALAQGETPSAGDMADALAICNRMFDEWAARKIMAYNVEFNVYTLTASHSPTLIGPGLTAPDLAIATRPVRIEGASWLMSSSSGIVDAPIITIRDDQWWANNRVKNLTSSLSTDLYYSAGWPNGELNFWPIPTVTNQVRLEMWTPLPLANAQNASFSLPPGYWSAVVLNLALELAPSFGANVPPMLARNAQRAMATLQGNNNGSPRIMTAQAGMKPSGSGRADFNWLDGSVI